MLPFNKLLKEKAFFLTKSQRKLLEYILFHEDESIFLNIGALAKRVNVSEATVVRLSQSLGFKGFPEFQRELRLVFKNKLKTPYLLQRTVKKVTCERDILIKGLQTDINNISETLEQTSIHEFKKFIKFIDSAKRIFLVGLRGSYALTIYFSIALEFLQKNVWIIQPGIGDMWDRLMGLKKGDLVIGIGFPRYTKQTVEVLRFAKHEGIKILTITDSLASPLAQYGDVVLIVRHKQDSFIESITAPLSLIHAIVTALGVFSKKSTMKSLKELEEIWEGQQVYYNFTK